MTLLPFLPPPPPVTVPEKKAKDKPSTSKSKKPTDKLATDKKMEKLDQKWSDRFNHLEALLMSKTFQPNCSSAVKVTPSHSPPANVPKHTEPFFQPTSLVLSYASVRQLARFRYFNLRAQWTRLLCFTASVFQPAQIRPSPTEIFTQAHWY